MKKIITAVTLMSLLAACGEKTAKENYAIISGRVSTPGEIEKVLLAQNNEVVKEIPVGSDGSFLDTIRPLLLPLRKSYIAGSYLFRQTNQLEANFR